MRFNAPGHSVSPAPIPIRKIQIFAAPDERGFLRGGMMAAPAGNQFWRARSSHGRAPIFPSPEKLWEACCEYFDWVEANPLWEDKLVTFQGTASHEPVAKMRAMTLDGLCIFLDIGRRTWDEYCKRDDFVPVATRVEEIVRTQKFQGAAADLLNPNIIARDLGLTEKSELAGMGGGPLQISVVKFSE